MELRHFNHNHGLVFHQIAQGSEIHCSGCKSPGSGNVYVCWQCGYFLHEHCFRAQRSLKHPSHPLHPLTLVPSPTYPSGSFVCNSCNLGGDGFSYSCSECEFDIHVHCANMPNPNPHVAPSPLIAPNFPVPNSAIYPPIQTYPPPHNAAIPYNPQSFPPQPQNTTYPPIPNNPLPQTTADPYNQNNPIPAYPPPTGPPLQYPGAPAYYTAQPNQTVPDYSAGVNSTTNPPPPTKPTTPVQNNNPQPVPPTMIKHFSHPHVLKAMEIDPKNAKVCSACERGFSGSAYCCTESHCSFNLHKACFDAPREFRHKSHPQHPLTLVAEPPYSDGFTCNACLKEGKAFAYTCATCSYDLHIHCVRWPESVTRSDHKHPMTLYHSCHAAAGVASSQEVNFMCDVCREPVHEMGWVYNCRECDFGTHLECVTGAIKEGNVSSSEGKSQEVLLTETELKFAVLQLLLEAQGRKAAIDNI